MLSERLSKLGASVDEEAIGLLVRDARDGGRSSSSDGGGEGSWCR